MYELVIDETDKPFIDFDDKSKMLDFYTDQQQIKSNKLALMVKWKFDQKKHMYFHDYKVCYRLIKKK